MNNIDIRWKQRFSNFEKAFNQLSEAHERLDRLDYLAKEGFIQRFEYTLELAWKTLKDYLEDQEVVAKFPRDVIKQAFQAELIDDGEIWMKMLKKEICWHILIMKASLMKPLKILNMNTIRKLKNFICF